MPLIHRRPPIIRGKSRPVTRLAVFILDASKRSSWADPQALTWFAIDQANEALLAGFR